MALRSEPSLRKVNDFLPRHATLLAILLAIFLQIVTAGSAFSDGGHGGAPVSGPNAQLPVLCLPYETIHSQLTRAGEEIVASGPTLAGQLGIFYLNPTKGTWTWVGRMSSEEACVIAAGEGWRRAPSKVSGERS